LPHPHIASLSLAFLFQAHGNQSLRALLKIQPEGLTLQHTAPAFTARRETMKMDERYSNATYGSAGLAAFFASLSLQDWGFIIGVAFSIILGVLTYRLNKREQMKRTKILQDILNKTDSSNPSATAKVLADLGQKAPKEI
jgi:hypothetical protein